MLRSKAVFLQKPATCMFLRVGMYSACHLCTSQGRSHDVEAASDHARSSPRPRALQLIRKRIDPPDNAMPSRIMAPTKPRSTEAVLRRDWRTLRLPAVRQSHVDVAFRIPARGEIELVGFLRQLRNAERSRPDGHGGSTRPFAARKDFIGRW